MSRTEINDVNQRIDIDTINPIGDFLLVEMIEKFKTASGIIIPKGERSASRYARVMRVGWGTENPRTGEVYPMQYKPGEIVLFMDYAGDRLSLDGGKYRTIREHGIWAVVEMDKHLNITKIIPHNDVIVLEFPILERSLSGVLELPGNVQTSCRVGTVVSAGPGIRNLRSGEVWPLEVKPGDKVVALRYSGANVWMGGKEYRLANQTDVKCILEGDGQIDTSAVPHGFGQEDPVIRDERRSREQLQDYADRGIISKELLR